MTCSYCGHTGAGVRLIATASTCGKALCQKLALHEQAAQRGSLSLLAHPDPNGPPCLNGAGRNAAPVSMRG